MEAEAETHILDKTHMYIVGGGRGCGNVFFKFNRHVRLL